MTSSWIFAACVAGICGLLFSSGKHAIFKYAILGALLGLVAAIIYKITNHGFDGSIIAKWSICFGLYGVLIEYYAWLLASDAKRAKKELSLGNETQQSIKIGKIHMRAQRFQEAADCFDAASDFCSTDPDLFLSRGTCLQSLGWHLDAIDDFTRAISLEPSDCNLYFQRAMSKTAVGDDDGFNADIEQAIILSKADTAKNRMYNENARNIGHESVENLYAWQLAINGGEGIAKKNLAARRAEAAKQRGRRITNAN